MKTMPISRTLIRILFSIILASSYLVSSDSSLRILSPFIFLIGLFALQTQVKLVEYSIEGQSIFTDRSKLLAESLTTLAHSVWFLLLYDAYLTSIVVNGVEIREMLSFFVYFVCVYTWMGLFFLRVFFKKASIALNIQQTQKVRIISQARSEVLKSLVSVILSLLLAGLLPNLVLKSPVLMIPSEDPKITALVVILNEAVDISRFHLLTILPLGLSMLVLAIGVFTLWSNRKVLQGKGISDWILSVQFLSSCAYALKDFVSKKGTEIVIFLGGILLLSTSAFGKEIHWLSSLYVPSFAVLSISQAILLGSLVLTHYYWTRQQLTSE